MILDKDNFLKRIFQQRSTNQVEEKMKWNVIDSVVC